MVVKGSCPGQLVELHGERMVMGRHPSCQIVLDNAAVSRNHAQILESHGTYYIEDLRSRNGTLVNGRKIQGPTRLRDGDEIGLSERTLTFLMFAGQPTGAAPQVRSQFSHTDDRTLAPSDARRVWIALAAAVIAIGAVYGPLLHAVHSATELLVQSLP